MLRGAGPTGRRPLPRRPDSRAAAGRDWWGTLRGHPGAAQRRCSSRFGPPGKPSRRTRAREPGLRPFALPAIRSCLQRGDTDEYPATLVARELGCLSEADRAKADVLVAEKMPRQGCRAARSHAAGIVARLDPDAVLATIRRAVKGRLVAIRNLPDAMVQLSAVLPVATGVAAYASLCRHADAVAAGGDPVERGRGQIMADEYVARLLGLTGRLGTGRPTRWANPDHHTHRPPLPQHRPGTAPLRAMARLELRSHLGPSPPVNGPDGLVRLVRPEFSDAGSNRAFAAGSQRWWRRRRAVNAPARRPWPPPARRSGCG